MYNKKAQGLSVRTVVIAAIVIIVLVVLWGIFTGKMKFFSKDLESSDNRGQMSAKRLAQQAVGKKCLNKVVDTNCKKESLSSAECSTVKCTFANNECTGIPDCGDIGQADCGAGHYNFCEWVGT